MIVSIAGREGQASTLPFGIRDPQPELAQPDRPVWVLAAQYPKFAGSSEPGGAGTSNPKTFDFGALKPGATANVVWKLSAVRTGRYMLRFVVDAGLSGQAKAESPAAAANPAGRSRRSIARRPQHGSHRLRRSRRKDRDGPRLAEALPSSSIALPAWRWSRGQPAEARTQDRRSKAKRAASR